MVVVSRFPTTTETQRTQRLHREIRKALHENYSDPDVMLVRSPLTLDQELWRSGLLKKSDSAKSLKIDITGVKRVVLRVTGGGDTPGRVQADWAEPRITRTPGKP